MKKFKSILTICMALAMLLSCIPAVHAAEVPEATINMDANCSLTIWKYDWTNAVKDGVWNEDSFISTGWRESYVEDVLGDAVRDGDSNGSPDHSLGNGQTSNGYAIKGVGFTIALTAMAVIREVFGAASFAGTEIPALANYKIEFLTKAPGGLLVYGLLIALVCVITKGKAPLKKSFSCAGCPNASTCHTACTEKGDEQ